MAASVGNIFFERGDGGSPESFTRICEIFSISGLGETNALVETTTFCSGGNREYIPGLADGTEITVEANYDPEAADLANMIGDVKAKARRDYRIVIEEGSPAQNITFAAVPLSWTLNPKVDDRNTIGFTFKISGGVTLS